MNGSTLPHSGVKYAVRTAVHECGCVIAYRTDRLGEYPEEVNGCATNDRLFEDYLACEPESRIEQRAFIARVKGHRGREIG